MVLYVLYAKAELEGIATLSLIPRSNICISVRNPLSHDETRERVVIDPSELHDAEIPSTKKHREEHASHFAMKWEGEMMRSTIRIIDDDVDDKLSGEGKNNARSGGGVAVRGISERDSGVFVPILKLECDGLEPYAFHPLGNEFSVINSAGIKGDKVDLSDGEWSDYDLSYGSSLIKNFETKFE